MSAQPHAVERTPSTLAGWFAVGGGIAAWMAHLVAEASLVELTCEHSGVEWVMHAATLVCALGALLALLVSVRLTRVDSRPWRFVGQLGVISSVTNLVLIAFEGSYIALFSPCS